MPDFITFDRFVAVAGLIIAFANTLIAHKGLSVIVKKSRNLDIKRAYQYGYGNDNEGYSSKERNSLIRNIILAGFLYILSPFSIGLCIYAGIMKSIVALVLSIVLMILLIIILFLLCNDDSVE